jgi:hypothetical protein
LFERLSAYLSVVAERPMTRKFKTVAWTKGFSRKELGRFRNYKAAYVGNINLGNENGEEVKDDDAVNLHCQTYTG